MKTTQEIYKDLLESSYQEEYNKSGFVTHSFLVSDTLFQRCTDALISIYPLFNLGQKCMLNHHELKQHYNIALREIKFNYSTVIDPSISLNKGEVPNWLNEDRINSIGWDSEEIKTYRSRYFKYLEKIGRSSSIIIETKRSSLEILKKLGDPKSQDDFFIKGLVVGSVQSGKTQNFNAVLNSSIDVGYKLIIVLSGIMEDLRRQTQNRIEFEVEGKMISRNKFLGVGEIVSFGPLGSLPHVNQISIPTSSEKDFDRSMQLAQFTLNTTNILVCKKNTSVLQNLILWLNDFIANSEDKLIDNIPLLIIDDEADNASINNLGHKGKEYSNKINGHIRALLALFKKKTYIGYTATPFANILQDWNKPPEKSWIIRDASKNIDIDFKQEGNLFPDDFIELLNPPSNYIGPKNFFETRIENIKKIDLLIPEPLKDHISEFPERVEELDNGELKPIKKVNNWTEFDEDKDLPYKFESFQEYKKLTRATTQYDEFPKKLPNSLKEAINCFIISIAIRQSRRSEISHSKFFQPHNTMLVHISRFSLWQNRTKDLIIEYLDQIKSRLENDQLYSSKSIYAEFEILWNKYYEVVVNNIREYLPENYEDPFLLKRNFEDVKKLLIASITDINILAVNTIAKDRVDYSQGEKKYIVIGGNKLSRGFTLEGLTINYFTRNTNYADTLLQMGRWFGYRPGYLDCCKLFTTKETLLKFDQCTWTIEELELEFKKLASEYGVNAKKPVDYATKVLTHPGALLITRPNILKNAVKEVWSYEDSLTQTTKFKITPNSINKSWSKFLSLLNSNKQLMHYDDAKKFIKIKADSKIVFDILESQETFFNDNFPVQLIKRFVKLSNNYNQLINWTIAIKTTGKGDTLNSELSNLIYPDVPINLTQRSGPNKDQSVFYNLLKSENIFRASGNSSNIVTSSDDISILLTKDEISVARNEFSKQNPNKNFPENIYRKRFKETDALMLVYLMDLKSIFGKDDDLSEKAKVEGINLDIPLIGFALAIPPFKSNVSGEYLFNKHILQNIESLNDDTEDELIEEDEEGLNAIENED